MSEQSEQVSSSQDREPESDWHGHMAEDTSTKRTKDSNGIYSPGENQPQVGRTAPPDTQWKTEIEQTKQPQRRTKEIVSLGALRLGTQTAPGTEDASDSQLLQRLILMIQTEEFARRWRDKNVQPRNNGEQWRGMVFGALVTLVIAIAAQHMSPNRCRELEDPLNGRMTLTGLSFKDTALIECNDGYLYSRPEYSQRQCRSDGKWSGQEGFCQAIKCPDLVAPANGNIAQSGKGQKAQATITCDIGYTYSEPLYKELTCQADGTWSGRLGACKVRKCPELLDPPHGYILQPGTHYMAKAIMMCDEGYTHSQPRYKHRTCQEDGTWSGKEGFCESIQCPELVDPTHGNIVQPIRIYGAQVTITCDVGYTYSEPLFQYRTCQADGTWSGKQGVCTVVQCPELVDPANGYIYQSSKIYQAKVTITCDAGYVYSERSFQHRTCKADGTWSGKQGVCKIVACPDVHDVANGMISANGGHYKERINLVCDPDYELHGPHSIHCQYDGTWSSRLGKCKELKAEGIFSTVGKYLPYGELILKMFGR